MGVLIILIIASLLVAIGFLIAFIWSVKSGQYEDDYTPALRILFDDNNPEDTSSKKKNNKPNNQHQSSCK